METDAEGKFLLDKVIPGPKFSLWFTHGQRRLEPVTKMEPRSVAAGAVLDFGESKLKPRWPAKQWCECGATKKASVPRKRSPFPFPRRRYSHSWWPGL